jgi:hypothetical protein
MLLPLNLEVEETQYETFLSFLRTLRYVKVEQPISTLRPVKKQRNFGSMKGLVLYMSPDFNAPLEDFNEYM